MGIINQSINYLLFYRLIQAIYILFLNGKI